MRKLATFAALGALALSSVSIPISHAEARNGRNAAAIVAGVAAGALIAGAASSAYASPVASYGSYYPSYGYGYAGQRYAPVRVYEQEPYYAPRARYRSVVRYHAPRVHRSHRVVRYDYSYPREVVRHRAVRYYDSRPYRRPAAVYHHGW